MIAGINKDHSENVEFKYISDAIIQEAKNHGFEEKDILTVIIGSFEVPYKEIKFKDFCESDFNDSTKYEKTVKLSPLFKVKCLGSHKDLDCKYTEFFVEAGAVSQFDN